MTQITQRKTFSQLLDSDSVKNRIQSVLKEKSTQFVTSALSLVNSDEKLQSCEPSTIFNACLVSASLDLPINNNLGFAYIIPYNDRNKGMIAQFQMGYKGFKQLSLRTGQFKTIHATDVREGEISFYDRLTGEIEFNWIEDETERESKQVVGYVSYFEILNGFKSTFYMTKANVDKHAKKYSQTFKKGFGVWKEDFDSMALKTVTKLNLSKNAPLSVEMQKAIIVDQAIVKEVSDDDTIEVDYVDNGKQEISNESKIIEIEALLNEVSDPISEEDNLYIQNIIETKDTLNYDKVINILKSKQRNEKQSE